VGTSQPRATGWYSCMVLVASISAIGTSPALRCGAYCAMLVRCGCQGGSAMRSEEGGDSGEDASSSVHRPSDGHHPGDLEGMVDELEQRVVAERRSAAAQGSAGRRGAAAPRTDEDQDPE